MAHDPDKNYKEILLNDISNIENKIDVEVMKLCKKIDAIDQCIRGGYGSSNNMPKGLQQRIDDLEGDVRKLSRCPIPLEFNKLRDKVDVIYKDILENKRIQNEKKEKREELLSTIKKSFISWSLRGVVAGAFAAALFIIKCVIEYLERHG